MKISTMTTAQTIRETQLVVILWAVVMVLVFVGWMPLPDLAPPA